MKKILLIIVLLFSVVSIKAQTKNKGVVLYSITMIPLKGKENVSNSFLDRVEDRIKDFQIELRFNGVKSYSVLKKPKAINDSDESLLNMASALSRSSSVYYGFLKDDKIIKERNFIGDTYLIGSAINKNSWNFLQETQKIGKYTCYKAIRKIQREGRKGKFEELQEVWYTLEIPAMFGPKNFIGLPGLVLKVRQGSVLYEASKVVLNPDKEIEIPKHKKGISVSEKEFKKIARGGRDFFKS